MADILLSRRARDELSHLPEQERARVRRALQALRAGAPNLDIRPLVGAQPWLRLRVGDIRVLFRRLPAGDIEPAGTIFVGRVVNRRGLDDAVGSLPLV